jgi:hypothetical protein
MTRFKVTAKAEGNPPFVAIVEADDEFKARNPVMAEYPFPLHGRLVTFEAEQIGPVTFEIWQATGRDVDDLRDHSDSTQFYPEDYPDPVPGRLYDAGWMRRMPDGTYWFCVFNWDDCFADLAEAERVLWEEYAYPECYQEHHA